MPDEGRKPGLPDAKIIAVIGQCCSLKILISPEIWIQTSFVHLSGAPKSKTDVYCKRATEKYPGCVHIQAMVGHSWISLLGRLQYLIVFCMQGLSADDLVQKIKDTSAAEIILLENFPAHNGQVEMFNSTVGVSCSKAGNPLA